MIVRDHLPWIRVWPQVWKKLAAMFVYDLTVVVLYVFAGINHLGLSSLPLGMLGSAIGVFLAFRTGSAYDRWWEARTLWGGLVNNSRSWARQVLTLISSVDNEEEADRLRRRLVVLQIAFVHALRCHLRGQNPFPELRGVLDSPTVDYLRGHKNVPAAILLRMGHDLRMAHDRGWLDTIRWSRLDQTLSELTNIQGACERIKNTPLPRQYDYFPRLLVNFFCLLLPLGFVEGLALLTPIASSLVSFTFIVLDTIGRDIETPFENTVHDTPMTNLSRTIEINLRQHMGDSYVPREVQPVAGFMY